MGKCLIVLTRKYPYSYGETSLQDELPFHIPYYDDVLILAQDVSPGDTETRMPPTGVSWYNTAKRNREVSRAIDKVKSPLLLLKRDKAIASDRKAVKGHPVRKVFLYTFEERCLRLIKEAIDDLKGYDFTKYDEVVLYSYWFFANARAATGIADYLKRKGCRKVRIISRAHRYDLYENRNKLNYLPMREYLLERISKVYACSLDGAEHLKRLYPEYEDHITVGLLGTKDCGVKDSKRGDMFHIVSCCRVVPVKRLERLADTLKLINKPVLWTMIGGGVEGDDSYYEKVKEHVESVLKDKDNIKVEFTGAIPHEDIFKYYQEHDVDVFINVSSSEGIPQVIMEAGSFGTPIIATDVGGTNEILLDNENGYIIPEDFEDRYLADRIEQMMSLSDEEYYQMRKRSREIWEERFNAKKNNELFARQVYGEEE